MLSSAAWATGFLTHIIWTHLKRRYPDQVRSVDPRSFFSVFEGSESLEDPAGLLLDSHAWLPEEVLRELLIKAEGISGKKDIAYHAALDYFEASRKGLNPQPSIFEMIARSFSDIRSVAVLSGLWGEVYTTFMRLQAFPPVPGKNEMIILSQTREEFQPLIANHFMLKGNYEGFVRLFEGIEDPRMEELFLQYRVQDIVDEFPGYHILEEEGALKILDTKKLQVIAEFRPIGLGNEDAFSPDLSAGGEIPEGFSDWIVSPAGKKDGMVIFPLASPRNKPPVLPDENSSEYEQNQQAGTGPLQVIREGSLSSGDLRFEFKKGMIFNAPYSRYRFRWRETRPVQTPEASISASAENLTRQLFSYLVELKRTQQRLLAYAVENRSLQVENSFLREQDRQVRGGGIRAGWPGKSPAMKPVFEWVSQSGPTYATVLITGETGTGKEVIAREVHRCSNRRRHRFVSVNCGAIPEGLMESELFGHEKGSFTGALSRKIGKFEWASKGTLFLDEIGELPPAMQVKLLRVLQERELQRLGGHETIRLDVRIIAATNQGLQERMEKGLFRRDLFYRLNVVPIHLPPLRERLEDLADLALEFLNRFSARLRKAATEISPLSLDLMRAYSWPGNIRELENVMERSVILMPGDRKTLEPQFLPPEIRALEPVSGVVRAGELAEAPDVKNLMDRIEWNMLVDAMQTEGSMDKFLRKIEWSLARRAITKYGSKTEAARVLKRTYRWIRKLEKEMTEGPSA